MANCKPIHVTQEELKRRVAYDPETGQFTRLTQNKRGVGWDRPFGWQRKSGYWLGSLDRREYFQHRLAFLYMTGQDVPSGMTVDHINGVPSDNRWCNLRLAVMAQQGANTKRRSDNTSGFKGVVHFPRYRFRPWRAEIKVGPRSVYLGAYKTPEEAHAAYCRAAVKYFGEFARFE